MTPTQVWITLTELLKQLYPGCDVKRVYAPTEDLENIAYSEQPNIWVTLNSLDMDPVNTMASYIEGSYNFRLTVIWKLKDDNLIELDKRLDMLHDIMMRISHSKWNANESTLFFGNPSIESIYDDELITNTGCYVATLVIPVTVYESKIKHIKP